MNDLCFVLMPFGEKTVEGYTVNFDQVYAEIIKPAVLEAGLDPVRADEEQAGGIIHKPMFERLLLCDYAIADLTGANVNVYYELGVRHAQKPHTTLQLYAGKTQLPFDNAINRAFPYQLDAQGSLINTQQDKENITAWLRSAQENAAQADPEPDSPIHQLLQGYPNYDMPGSGVFAQEVRKAEDWKEAIRKIVDTRGEPEEKLKKLEHWEEANLPDLQHVDAGVILALFYAYRKVGGTQQMVSFYDRMPKHITGLVPVREQYGFALNREGRQEDAIRVLEQVLTEHGPSPETYGILARVYKDRWSASADKSAISAIAALDQAIACYLKGFEADMRDYYPGINALNLLRQKDPDLPEIKKLTPVVTFALTRQIATKKPGYWEYATLLELEVLNEDFGAAKAALVKLHTVAGIENWMPGTTINNLSFILEWRAGQGKSVSEIQELMDGLQELADGLS
ncbi:MAG: TRAFs-binding domain-containing protein [Bacteroidota bacterium]